MQAELLQGKIQCLTDLYNSVQALRQIPPALLTLSGLPSLPPSMRAEFRQLKEIRETICSEPTQEALRAARDSLRADKSNINYNGRRENRKKRRPPSPASPQPYITPQRKSSSLFPVSDNEPPALRAGDLVEFIRDFNRSHTTKLHILSRIQQQISNPVVVLLTIPDVLSAYINLGYDEDDRILVAHNVVALSPREKKSPYSQSDFIVYQSLSQQIAKMIQSHPRVSFQILLGYLCSYDGLFIERCSTCERVLSAEGHVPPVVRVWTDAEKEGERGKWDPRHVTCVQG